MVKTDCFAYVKREDGAEMCAALNAMYCKKEECVFYKNKEKACKECAYKDCKGCAGAYKP